jgi:hypothetical protein
VGEGRWVMGEGGGGEEGEGEIEECRWDGEGDGKGGACMEEEPTSMLGGTGVQGRNGGCCSILFPQELCAALCCLA